MADKTLNTRISLKYDEYADWKAQNPVLMKGEVAITSIPTTTSEKPEDIKNSPPIIAIKVGDGNGTHYLDLPFVSGFQADVYPWAKKPEPPKWDEIGNKPFARESAGSNNITMEGALTTAKTVVINGSITADNHAVTKKWVEDKKYVTTNDQTQYVKKDGTTKMTAPLQYETNVTPSNDNEAATVKQVKDVQTNLTNFIDTTAPETYATQQNPTFSGTVTLPAANPTANTQAAHKKYVDDGVQDAKSYADGIKTSLGSVFTYKGTVDSIDALNTNHPASADQVGHVYHVTQKHAEYVCAKVDSNTTYTWEELGSAVDLSGYVEKKGSTMNGFLTLHADPEEPKHAATKQYVDTKASNVAVSVTDSEISGQFVTDIYKEGNVIKAHRDKVNINHLDQTSGDTLILNCGDATNCNTIT